MKRDHLVNFVYLIVALIAITVVRDLWLHEQKVDRIPYSEFRALLDAGRVGEVTVGDTYIRGTLAKPEAGEKPEFMTEKLQPDLAEFLVKYKITYSAELKEIVDFLKDPAAHSRLGARLPKGIPLVGPPRR